MSVGSIQAGIDRTLDQLRRDVQSPKGMFIVVLLGIALVSPLVVSGFWVGVILQIAIYTLVVLSWNFIAGYFGLFTFAHAALFGVGGYGTAIVATEYGIPPIVALLLGGVVAGLFSLPVILPVLRLVDDYVAMVTLAYAEILHRAAIILDGITGGPTGYTGITPMFGGNQLIFFYFVLTVVAGLAFLQYGLLVSRFGLIARATRESEGAAKMLGNNTIRFKTVGFFIGSSIAGIAGGLQAYYLGIVSPPMMALAQMIDFLAMAVIGGLGVMTGPVAGTVIVQGSTEALRQIGEVRLLIWGILLIVVILYFPEGIMGADRIWGRLNDLTERFRSDRS